MRKFKIMRLFILALCGIFLLTACSSSIYIVRHAEKEAATGGMSNTNPNLTAAGNARAAALADSLSAIAISAVYATPYNRTQQTGQPTASQKNLTVRTYAINHGAALIDSLSKIQKKAFLVVGHSNTVPGLIQSLGLTPSMQEIPENDYDNFFIVKISWFFGRSMRLIQKTYGAPSP